MDNVKYAIKNENWYSSYFFSNSIEIPTVFSFRFLKEFHFFPFQIRIVPIDSNTYSEIENDIYRAWSHHTYTRISS